MMREEILNAAEILVQRRGFDSVTFQEIADEVGLKKPSLFHHVKNKDELARLLIERCNSKYGPEYLEVIEKDISAPRKLKEVAKIFENGLKQNRRCLLAAIGGAKEVLSPDASALLEQAANGAIERFAAIFVQGRKEGTLEFKGKPEPAAMAFFAMLQGLQTLCQLKEDNVAFSRAVSTYIDSLTA